MLIRWLSLFIPALLIEFFCYILAPFVAPFCTATLENDKVKRKGGRILWLMRDNLIKPLSWFQTHDNNCDEWWYGVYNVNHYFKFARNWTQKDYDNSKLIRYYCRLMWLWRNCAYGFHYNLFGIDKEDRPVVSYAKGKEGVSWWFQLDIYQHYFQLQFHIPLAFTCRYSTTNIGWKAHKNVPRVLYANRLLISTRKYK